MTHSISVLPDRAVVAVEGAEARDFLHSLLTCDVEALSAGQAAYGALLTPQGKVLFDVFAVATEAGFLLDAGAASADDLVKRLMLYKLRRKVEIARTPELGVAAAWEAQAPPEIAGHVFQDPRTEEMGYRVIAARDALEAEQTAEPEHYHARRIALGLADSERDIGSGQMFPHEANLDQIGGVSFSKGCFVGQEVVSRMEHRGTARSRVVPVRFEGQTVASGTAITAGGRSLGTVLSTENGRGLALVRLDRADAAVKGGEPLMADGTAVVVERPPWARYAVPGAEEA